MSLPAWHIAILIPARDEEELLPRCLESIRAARMQLPANVSSDVVVCVDRSRDRTLEIARALLQHTGVAISSSAGVVGHARSIAATTALLRCELPLERCWLANTDADCIVPTDWLLDQLRLADQGCAAVAGIVGVDSFTEHNVAVEALFQQSYRVNEDGTHPHVHGANLGIRADAYVSAGGWGSLATAEDHDLWSRLQAMGVHAASDAALRVTTSGRRVGRAPLGFAAALAAHNEVAA